MLKENAESLWRGAREQMIATATEVPLEWKNFKNLFLVKHFPHSVLKQKEPRETRRNYHLFIL